MRAMIAACFFLLVTVVVAPPVARSETAVLHYETRIGGGDATVWHPAHSEKRLPVALLLSGANVRRTYYSGFATALAEYGFVVVVPTHYPLPPLNYTVPSQDALPAVLAWAKAQAGVPSSPVASLIDPENLVVAGHSYGGAAALYAAANRCQPPFCFGLSYRRPPELRAIVGHGTNATAFGAVDTVAVDNVPIMFVNGSMDGVSEPAEAYETFTKLTGSPATAFVTVLGANHFGLTDENNPPGAVPDIRPAALPRASSIAIEARWTATWFLAQLGDAAAAAYLRHGADEPESAVTVELR